MALIDKLSAIGDAIREKTGKDDLLTLEQMPGEIQAIETGGGDLPEEALIISGDCNYRFAYNNWNWFIEKYGNKITTEKITNANNMFLSSNKLTKIPFSLNFFLDGNFSSKSTILDSTFPTTTTPLLQEYPEINITTNSTNGRTIILGTTFGANGKKQNIYFGDNVKIGGFSYKAFQYYPQDTEPTWLFDMCDWDFIRTDVSTTFGSPCPTNWAYSYYVKTIPSMPKFYANGTGSYYHHWYQFSITNCYSLQRIVLPRPGPATLTSTPSGLSFSGLCSLKDLTFDIQDNGEPYTANWKNITMNLSNSVGYSTSTGSSIPTGLDINKRVDSDQTYSLLKNDEEWWSNKLAYSCYNHDSAVGTINSLPDTSAYGTNTIKFKGTMGSLTDGGAINTLTEEEIAVATAKGWTVSFA